MKHKTVADVMTHDVVSVRTTASFQQVVRTFAEQDISAAPVLGPRARVVGIVSEADLLGRQARAGGAAANSIWQLLRHKAFARKGAARTVADLMTTPVVTVSADSPLTGAAATLAKRGLKHAPVVDAEGALIGFVSRKDLLSVYLRDDADVAAEIRAEVLLHAMYLAPKEVSVEVVDGIVTLCGKVERQSMIDIITALASAVDGVVDVCNDIVADVDDTHIPAAPPENVGIFHAPGH
ncbi:CBS domain-containing protein [Nocardia sp. NPDC046473]|uniref:CBS domain-containing protein n=1 Tax=Nocardia sp. NPDC046473 TaxID=3155733 RepID=UPI0033DEEC94